MLHPAAQRGCRAIVRARFASPIPDRSQQTSPSMNWHIPHALAGTARPGRSLGSRAQVQVDVVEAWLAEARQAGIASILCLLHPDDAHFGLYRELPCDLLDFFRQAGFHVSHVPLKDYEQPSPADLAKAYAAYLSLTKPVLVHCSAGQGRTGAVIRHILQNHFPEESGRNPSE